MPAAHDDGVLTVLLAGATGMLGSRTAQHLLAQPGTVLRVLVRPGRAQDPATARVLQQLQQRGAVVIECELTDAASLDAATELVYVVVSTLQGGHEVIVKGQVALAEAAARSGAQRFVPSDFNLDLFKAVPGEHADFDLRREADERISVTGLTHVHVLSGVLMDGLIGPPCLFDHAARTASYWGSGDEEFDATSVETTAQFTARVACDPGVGSGAFAVAAQRLSFSQVVGAVEEVTGHRYAQHSLGSIDDLAAEITAVLTAGGAPRDVVDGVHVLYMLTGRAALHDLQNHRYPEIRPETIADTARGLLSGPDSDPR